VRTARKLGQLREVSAVSEITGARQTETREELNSSAYWRDMALDKVVPSLITNLLTALGVWFGAVVTGYVQRPSAPVLGGLVFIIGSVVLIGVQVMYPRLSEAPPRHHVLPLLYLTVDILALIIFVAFLLYSYGRRAEGPQWIVVLAAFGPAVVASLISDVIYWLQLRRHRNESRELRRRHRIRLFGVSVMILAAAVWWGLAWFVWSDVSAQPGMVLVLLGVTYLLAHDRDGHLTKLKWRKAAALASGWLLVGYTALLVGTGH
jgi:hypothetical protein